MENYLIYFVFILGLILGSFLNCLLWRLKVNESVGGRSYCPHCRQQLTWYENIPLFSFIFLRGSCRYCHKKISWQYPLVELSCALLFSFVYIFWKNNLASELSFSTIFILNIVRDWVFVFILLLIFVYDLLWQKVPMLALWPGIVIVSLLSLFLGTPFLSLLLAVSLAVSFFLAQYLITKGKGLGSGDIWIGAFLATRFVDLGHLSLAIFSTYMIGSIVAIVLLLKKKKKMRSKLPLGPFLVTGALISLFFAKEIIDWYLSLLFF